ncbi:hypothetical protein RBB50_008804 [Rhinocladiella similis]
MEDILLDTVIFYRDHLSHDIILPSSGLFNSVLKSSSAKCDIDFVRKYELTHFEKLLIRYVHLLHVLDMQNVLNLTLSRHGHNPVVERHKSKHQHGEGERPSPIRLAEVDQQDDPVVAMWYKWAIMVATAGKTSLPNQIDELARRIRDFQVKARIRREGRGCASSLEQEDDMLRTTNWWENKACFLL